MTEGSYEQQLAAAFAATQLESMCELDIDSVPNVHRMSGIICTIGTYAGDEGTRDLPAGLRNFQIYQFVLVYSSCSVVL